MTKTGVFEVGDIIISNGTILQAFQADTDGCGESVCDDGKTKCFFLDKAPTACPKCYHYVGNQVIFKEIPPKYVVVILGQSSLGSFGENCHLLTKKELVEFEHYIKCFEDVGAKFFDQHPEITNKNPFQYFRKIIDAVLFDDEEWGLSVPDFQIEALDYFNDLMPITDNDSLIDEIISIKLYPTFNEREYVNY